MILIPAIRGPELPSAEVDLPHGEDVRIKSLGDGGTYSFPASVYVKKGLTYVEETKTVEITINPDMFRPYEKHDEIVTDKDHFLRVFVSIIFLDTGKRFEGYLYYEDCDEPREDRLFWGHVTGRRADRAGQTFDHDNPLVESDQYFLVEIALKDKTISGHPCTPGPSYDVRCESSPGCLLYYINSLTLQLSVDYTTTQKNVMTQIETALEPEEKVDEGREKPETEAETRVKKVLIFIAASIAVAVGVGVALYKLTEKEKPGVKPVAEEKPIPEERPVTVAEEKPIPEERPVTVAEEKPIPEERPVTVAEEKPIPEERPVFPLVGEGPRIIFEDQAFSITKDSVTIGRGEKADIQVPDPKNRISRVHAAIYRDERGQYWIRDNNSTNGTFIYADGKYKRVKKWLLHDGDTIGLSYDPSKGAHVILQFRTN